MRSKKVYDQIFKSKHNNWRIKHDHKNCINLDYQPDQLQQPDQPQQLIPKWVKVTKSRFDEIKSITTENRKKTIIDKKEITLDNPEKLVGDIVSRKVNKKKGNKKIQQYCR